MSLQRVLGSMVLGVMLVGCDRDEPVRFNVDNEHCEYHQEHFSSVNGLPSLTLNTYDSNGDGVVDEVVIKQGALSPHRIDLVDVPQDGTTHYFRVGEIGNTCWQGGITAQQITQEEVNAHVGDPSTFYFGMEPHEFRKNVRNPHCDEPKFEREQRIMGRSEVLQVFNGGPKRGISEVIVNRILDQDGERILSPVGYYTGPDFDLSFACFYPERSRYGILNVERSQVPSPSYDSRILP